MCVYQTSCAIVVIVTTMTTNVAIVLPYPPTVPLLVTVGSMEGDDEDETDGETDGENDGENDGASFTGSFFSTFVGDAVRPGSIEGRSTIAIEGDSVVVGVPVALVGESLGGGAVVGDAVSEAVSEAQKGIPSENCKHTSPLGHPPFVFVLH